MPSRCMIRVPDGAQSKSLSAAVTECTADMSAAAARGANVMVGGGLASIVLVGEVVRFGPSGTTFDPPATLRLPFCDEVIAKMRCSGLRLSVGAFRWDAGNKVWRELAGGRADGGVMEVESVSFSFYTVGFQVGSFVVDSLAAASQCAAASQLCGPPAVFSAIFPERVDPDGWIEVKVLAYPLAFQAQLDPLKEGQGKQTVKWGLPLAISKKLKVKLEDGSDDAQLATGEMPWNGRSDTDVTLDQVDCPASGSCTRVRLRAKIYSHEGEELGKIPFIVKVGAPVQAPFTILVFSARAGTLNALEMEVEMIRSEFRRVEDKVEVRGHGFPGPEDFLRELEPAKKVRVFHFAGHGAIVLQKVAGRGADSILPENFVGTLRNATTVECVILNSCSSLESGLSLRGTHVRYVVCWHGDVNDKPSREFALDFYKAFPTDGSPPLYCSAFVRACRLLDERYKNKWEIPPSPCLIWQDGASDPSDPEFVACKIESGAATWARGQWTGVSQEYAVRDAAAGEEAWQGTSGGDDAPEEGEGEDSEDEGEARNWLPHALSGKAEKEALMMLDPFEVQFSMQWDGKEIGSKLQTADPNTNNNYNGLTAKGFLIDQVLRKWGVTSYVSGVWGNAGAALMHAAQKLSDVKKRQRLPGVITKL